MDKSPSRCGRIRVFPVALDHHHGGEVSSLSKTTPGPHVGGRISPEYQEELPIWFGQSFKGVGGNRRPVAVHLKTACLDTRDAVHGCCHHLEPLRFRGHHASALLPRVTGRNQQHAVEPERVTHLGSNDQMSNVHRVERPSIHSESRHPPILRTGLRRRAPRSPTPSLG